MRIILIDDVLYAQLPSVLNHTGKPWVRIRPDTTEPALEQLSSYPTTAHESLDLASITSLIVAARTIKLDGPDGSAGVPATRYSEVVDVAKLPQDMPNSRSLLDAGLTTFQLVVLIDSQGRPVRVSQDYRVQGKHIVGSATYSKFNAGVKIVAPPKAQVASA